MARLRIDHSTPKPTQLLEGWELGDGWLVDIVFVAREGVPAIADLTIYFEKDDIPAGGLPLSKLRNLNLGKIFAAHGKGMKRFVDSIPLTGYSSAITDVEQVEPELPQRGRKTDLHRHVLLAKRWVEFVEEAKKKGRRPSPNIDLAKKEHLVLPTVVDLVHRWRHELGLLTMAGPGRADSVLTPKAEALLKEAKKRQAKKQLTKKKTKRSPTTKGRRRK